MDDVRKGRTPVKIPGVAPGRHTVKVLYGAQKREQTYIIEPGKDVEITIDFVGSGHIFVSSVPGSASIYLDGIMLEAKTPYLIKDSSAGEHSLRISKDGFVESIQTVSVKADEVVNVTVPLQLMTYTVKINSTPSGAQVLWDDVPKGTTPLVLDGVTAGKHKISLSKEGYEEHLDAVDVRNSAAERTFSLTEQMGTATITTNPSSVEAFIDGKSEGLTPLQRKLPPRTYTLRLRKDGFTEKTMTFTITRNQVTAVNENLLPIRTAPLEPRTYTVKINSTPSGAQVLWDDVPKGTTPLVLDGVTAGKHKISLSKEGYEEHLDAVDVRNSAAERTFSLTEQMGTATITTNPSSVEAFIDGKSEGLTPLQRKLPPRTYTLRLRKDGFTEKTMTFTITRNQVTAVNENLLPIRTAPLEPRTYTVKINSTPSGVQVLWDDVPKGTTPLVLDGVTAGKHKISLSKENYEERVDIVDVRNSAAERTFSLTEQTGIAVISTNPSSVEAFIDGKSEGLTPLQRKLPPRTYTLRLRKDGFTEKTMTFTITRNQVTAVNENLLPIRTAPLEPRTYTVKINSTPSGVQVLWDDVPKGTTPLVLDGVTAGKHKISLSKENYEERVDIVDVQNSAAERTFSLTEQTGIAVISTNPSSVEAFIDGKSEGLTPLQRKLPPRTYTLRLRKDGFTEKTMTFTITRNQVTAVNENLLPIKPPEPPPPGPKGRFIIRSDGTVVDKETKLMWLKNGNSPNRGMTWDEAMKYCESMNHSGHNDWKLPSREEWRTIVGKSGLDKGHPFTNLVLWGSYWSSSVNPRGLTYTYGVNVGNGSVESLNKSKIGYVWPVRYARDDELTEKK